MVCFKTGPVDSARINVVSRLIWPSILNASAASVTALACWSVTPAPSSICLFNSTKSTPRAALPNNSMALAFLVIGSSIDAMP